MPFIEYKTDDGETHIEKVSQPLSDMLNAMGIVHPAADPDLKKREWNEAGPSDGWRAHKAEGTLYPDNDSLCDVKLFNGKALRALFIDGDFVMADANEDLIPGVVSWRQLTP
jgi:hypothetical protein